MRNTNTQRFPATVSFLRLVLFALTLFLLALLIYLGAWAVSDEVYAVEAAQAQSTESHLIGTDEIAGWKRDLVNVCPLH